MTFNDKWLIERALKHKAAAAQGRRSAGARKPMPAIDDLWSQLQKETRRQALVYTAALGDPKALVVETPPDRIEVRTPDGRQLTIRVDRERRSMSEMFRDRSGASRTRRAMIRFVRNAAGEATFSFGGLNAAAGSLIRRLIC